MNLSASYCNVGSLLFCLASIMGVVGVAQLAYGILLLRDIDVIRHELEHICNPAIKSGVCSAVKLHTRWGLKLLAAVSGVQYCFRLMTAQAAVSTAEVEEGQSIETSGWSSDSDEADEYLLYQRMLEHCRICFNCSVAGVLVKPAVLTGPVQTSLRGVHAKELEKVFSKLARFLLVDSNLGIATLLDTISDGPEIGALERFGLRYSVVAPIGWRESRGPYRGLLWLGYREDYRPSEITVARIEQAAKQFARELATHREVCQLKSQVAAEQCKNHHKHELLNHLAHDIRSPLGNLRGILEILKLEEHEPENIRLISVALLNCTTLSETVESLLAYSQYQAGKLGARCSNFDLVPIVVRVVESFQVTAELKGLVLNCDTIDEVPVEAYADNQHVRRILTNLLSNALKYTEAGVVRVCCRRLPKGEVELQVVDTGIGMTTEQLSRLYTPFCRMSGTVIEGIGLGMTVTKALVELNQGVITATSTPGGGTTIRVRLPGATRQYIEEGKSSAPAEVLVVDDEPDFAMSLSRGLRHLGYQTEAAVSVLQAEKLILTRHFDVIISDGEMPGGGALQLLAVISKKAPLPVFIILTGSSAEAQWKKYGAAGAIAVVQKSVDLHELKALVDKLVSEHEGHQMAGLKIPSAVVA